MNDYTIETIKEEISKYFKGFFDNLAFKVNEYGVVMRGFRNGLKCEHIFDLNEINSLAYSLHHRLENIKGEFVRFEQSISLGPSIEKEHKFTGCRLNDTQYSIDWFSMDVVRDLIKWHVKEAKKVPKELLIDFRSYDEYINNGGAENVFYIDRYAGKHTAPRNLVVKSAICEHENIVEFKY